ncbi:MAG: enoyl-CoA hydratase/isomerase family protein [Pseudomonadales bacterium]
MAHALVLKEINSNVCYLTLNRPDKLNSLNVALFSELQTHIGAIKEDQSVKVVVLRGAGKCFSAGHDLGDISEGEETNSLFWHSEILRTLEKLPVPVIAAVHGHCYTGALEVALAADFILAADNAKFADTHAKWALAPIWGMSQRLPRRVGIATAKRMMFSCATIKADEAFRIGLCEAVYPQHSFAADVAAFANQISNNSSFTHAANKRLLEATDGKPMDAGLLWESMETEGVGPDMEERIAHFLKK